METLQPLPLRWRDDPTVSRLGRLFAPHAGLPEPEWLVHLEAVLAISRDAMHRAGYGDRFEDVEFRTVANDKPNAIALRQGEHGLVVLHSGLFTEVCAKIERAIRNPVFLADYLPMAASPGASAFSFAGGLADISLAEPRIRWAFSFLRRITDFIIHHELAHLTRGHHDLLHRRDVALALDEAMAASSTGRGTHRRRMMELDADAVALDMILIELTNERPFPDWKPNVIEDEYFNTLLAVIVLCQIFDRENADMGAILTLTHPAPVLRAIRFGEVLHATYEGQRLGDPARMYDLGDKAWWEASLLAQADGLRSGRWWGGDMRDVPEALVNGQRSAHLRFDAVVQRHLARD